MSEHDEAVELERRMREIIGPPDERSIAICAVIVAVLTVVALLTI